MDIHDATEQAYKNGYDKGMEDAVKCCNPTCHSKTWTAYNRLLNAIHDDEATKMDLRLAIADAIKLLEETPA